MLVIPPKYSADLNDGRCKEAGANPVLSLSHNPSVELNE
jgi:hypothetical protein